MARPSKLTPDITQLIGNNVASGLPYSFAAAPVGYYISSFYNWMKK